MQEHSGLTPEQARFNKLLNCTKGFFDVTEAIFLDPKDETLIFFALKNIFIFLCKQLQLTDI